MKNENKNILAVKPALLNRKIFLFIYALLKYIFLKKNQKISNQLNKRLNIWITKINTYIIKSEDKFISFDYTHKTLKNIISFLKHQSLIYCGDIIENILIFIFSKVFYCDKENAIYKYIFNNLSKIRENKSDFFKWIKTDKISPFDVRQFI